MIGKTLAELKVGQRASFTKTVSETDVYQFAGISGDFNPAHINEVYARETAFKTRIAHGILSAGFISAVLGNQLPGPGTVYIQQTLNFRLPVAIGDTVTATVTVAEILAEKKRVRLQTVCTNQEGRVVLDGEALVSPPRLPQKTPI